MLANMNTQTMALCCVNWTFSGHMSKVIHGIHVCPAETWPFYWTWVFFTAGFVSVILISWHTTRPEYNEQKINYKKLQNLSEWSEWRNSPDLFYVIYSWFRAVLLIQWGTTRAEGSVILSCIIFFPSLIISLYISVEDFWMSARLTQFLLVWVSKAVDIFPASFYKKTKQNMAP